MERGHRARMINTKDAPSEEDQRKSGVMFDTPSVRRPATRIIQNYTCDRRKYVKIEACPGCLKHEGGPMAKHMLGCRQRFVVIMVQDDLLRGLSASARQSKVILRGCRTSRKATSATCLPTAGLWRSPRRHASQEMAHQRAGGADCEVCERTSPHLPEVRGRGELQHAI